MSKLRLGVNVDHVGTIRNARGGLHPDPVRAALAAEAAGADGITVHLREDRRHIVDADLPRLKDQLRIPINFEMAATDEMLAIALSLKPHAACLVPEKRTEVTTEGGLDVIGQAAALRQLIRRLSDASIRVSLFVDPEPAQLAAARDVGAPVVELHTGSYAEVEGEARAGELQRLASAARTAKALGLECHAGHGLTFDNVGPVAALPEVVELNIGHFLIGEAVFTGLDAAIREMRRRMDVARGIAG